MLTLLYDKTFPPRPATSSANTIGINKSMGRLLSAGGTGSAAEFNGSGGEDMLRQFNYYGQVNGNMGMGLHPNIEDFTE